MGLPREPDVSHGTHADVNKISGRPEPAVALTETIEGRPETRPWVKRRFLEVLPEGWSSLGTMEAVEEDVWARSDRDAVRAAVLTTGSRRFAGVISTAAHGYREKDLKHRDRCLQTAGQDLAKSQRRRCRQGASDD